MSECGLKANLFCLNNITCIFTVTVDGLAATLRINVIGGGKFRYHVWLSDDDTGAKTTMKTPTSGKAEWEGVTDDDGEAKIVIQNTGAEETYFPNATFEAMNTGDSFDLGV